MSKAESEQEEKEYNSIMVGAKIPKNVDKILEKVVEREDFMNKSNMIRYFIRRGLKEDYPSIWKEKMREFKD